MRDRHPFWFSLPRSQALRETFFLGAILWFGCLGLQLLGVPFYRLDPLSQWLLNYTINPIFLLWFVLRIKPARQVWGKQTIRQILSAMLLIVLLYLLYLLDAAYSYFSLWKIYRTALLPFSLSELLPTLVLVGCIYGGWLFCASWIVRLFHYWHRRKQQSLAWKIVYAHILIITFLLSLGIIIIEVWGVRTQSAWGFINIIPTLFLMSGLTMVFLLLFVPPLAFFSQIVTRQTVKQLANLVVATTDLSSGKYSVRIPVVGEDEVAQLQANFNKMADELEQKIQDLHQERDHVATLLKERRELFANVSHELGTPIATLRGYLESNLKQEQEITPPSVALDLKIMEREVLLLQQRSEDLLTLAKVEVKKLPMRVLPCDIHPLIQTMVTNETPLAWRSSLIEIVLDLPPVLPLVHADPQRLEQALRNVLRNALRHTSPGGMVIVAAQSTDEHVIVTIEDTGEGIAPDELEHIWERFYQAQKSQGQGGTGLGLALVKEWMEEMGGQITVSSVLHEGSIFTFSLSLAENSH
jgi:signal transduction histidine kinase